MLIDEQIESNIAIQRLIRNFTKDSAERKLKEGYFEERLKKITHTWTQFKKNGAKPHKLALNPENEYFTKAKALVKKYEAIFSDGIPSVSGPSQRPRAKTGENLEPKAQSSRENEGEDLRLTSLKRRHERRLDDMEEFLCNRTERREVSTHVRQHMKELWKEIVKDKMISPYSSDKKYLTSVALSRS